MPRPDDPLRADDIPGHGRPGRIGLTICPGRTDRDRDLDVDLDTLRAAGTDVLVCLVEPHELVSLGVPTLGREVERRGMTFVHLPIRDQGVATDEDGHALVRQVLAMLDEGKNVVVHCMGGIGRSGTVAACVLVSSGLTPEQAIAAVRRARDPRSVETIAQERFVARWARQR